MPFDKEFATALVGVTDDYLTRASRWWNMRERVAAALMHGRECGDHIGSRGCRTRHLMAAREMLDDYGEST